MEAELLEILETLSIAIGGFLLKKYVFLEPNMEPKKQRIFYCISFIIIGTTFFILGKDIATITALFMIGLNVFLGRKQHKLRGLLLMIPFPGIINGLMIPIMLVPPYLLALSKKETWIYQFILYGILFLMLILFYVRGQNWRSWFQENLQHRSLRKAEKCLLWVVGVLMLLFSTNTTMQVAVYGTNMRTAGSQYESGLVSFIGISSVSVFVMTITIIVLIMQGNKRSFYHERISRMQSGMIKFMAEVVENRDDNTGGYIRRTAEYVERIVNKLKRRGIYSYFLK